VVFSFKKLRVRWPRIWLRILMAQKAMLNSHDWKDDAEYLTENNVVLDNRHLPHICGFYKKIK
jgi:hypothetical protein